MAVDIEFGNIKPFDCTGNPTSVGPRWRVLLSFFSRPRVSRRIHKNKPLTFAFLWTGCTGHFVTLSDPGLAPNRETQYAKTMRLLDAHF